MIFADRMGLTLLSGQDQPTQYSECVGVSDNASKCDASTEMWFDCIRRRKDQVVRQRVIGRIDKQGVVNQ